MLNDNEILHALHGAQAVIDNASGDLPNMTERRHFLAAVTGLLLAGTIVGSNMAILGHRPDPESLLRVFDDPRQRVAAGLFIARYANATFLNGKTLGIDTDRVPDLDALWERCLADAAGVEQLGAMRAALASVVKIADEAREEWDKAPAGMRAGKILVALAGGVPGYRADIDAIHAAINSAVPINMVLIDRNTLSHAAEILKELSPPDQSTETGWKNDEHAMVWRAMQDAADG